MSTPPTSTTTLRPGDLVDHYRVSRLLGSGGMGEVYLARDTRLGRRVALKLVRPETLGDSEEVQRFLFEAQVTARFNHPHIVTIYGVGEHEGRPYIALEYLEGLSLRERLQGGTPLAAKEVARIGAAIAEALAEAHKNNILHRDLKPENVMAPLDGRLRVVDFGLAKAIDLSRFEVVAPTESAALAQTQRGEALRFASSVGSVRGTPMYMAPEQWVGGEVSPSTDVWALGLILYEMIGGKHPYDAMPLFRLCTQVVSDAPVPWFDPSAGVPAALDSLIQRCLSKKAEERPSAQSVADGLKSFLESGRGISSTEEAPFRGLLPFFEEHSGWFFGRDSEVEEFLERLRHEAVLPVVGPSGAGKSSFVQAGVIPRLREKGRLLVLSMRPGERPFETLAARLGRADISSSERSSDRTGASAEDDLQLAKALEATPSLLGIQLQRLAERTKTQVLFVVDQLEEAYALVDHRETRQAFLEAVCGAADDAAEPVRVVLTLRDDFLGKLAETPAARRRLGHTMLLRSPGEDSLREIVTRPVEQAGYRYEDGGLVDEMLSAVRGEPACLPLLQFACSQLWEKRDKGERVLRRKTYESLGGVEGALARHADGVLEKLTSAHTRDAKQFLLRLVTPEGTRRAVRRSALLEACGAEAAEVLDRLVESRVLVSSKGKTDAEVELAHESLIRNWDRLASWIEESKGEIAFLAEVEQAALLWDKRGRSRQEVWRGDALHTARRRANQVVRLPELVGQFLEASLHEEQRSTRRRRVVVGAGFALLSAIAASAVGVSFALRAREQTAVRKQAEALFEGARAAVERSEPIVGRAHLRASLEIEDSLAARALWPRARNPSTTWSIDVGDSVTAVTALHDGKSVAAVGETGGWIVDLTTTEVRATPVLAGSFAIEACPDGAHVVVGHFDGRVTVHSMPDAEERVLGKLQGIVRSVACSGDSRWAVAAGDTEARVWPVVGGESWLVGSCTQRCAVAASGTAVAYSTGESLFLRSLDPDAAPGLLARRPGGFPRIRLNASGDTLVAQSPDGTVTVWDARARVQRLSFPFNPVGVSALSVASGSMGAVVCNAHECVNWSTSSGRVQSRIRVGTGGTPRSSDFVPEQNAVVFVNDAGRELRVWPLGPADLGVVQRTSATSATYSPSMNEVACTQHGGLVLRDASSGRATGILPCPSNHSTYRAEGKRLTVTNLEGNLEEWDPRSGLRHAVASLHSGYGFSVVADRSGELLPSAGVDGSVRLLGAGTLESVGKPMHHSAVAISVAFSPDSRLLASAGWDFAVRVWDTATQRAVKALDINGLGMVAQFSPEGKLLASSMRGGDGVALWRTDDWTRVPVSPRSGSNNIYGLAFHPDGERLLLGPIDGVGRIWNYRTGGSLELVGHDAPLNRVDFSPDGRYAVSSSDDGTVRTWESDTGHPFWRAPLALLSPARALTQQGWIDLDADPPAPKPLDTRWSQATHEHAREASADLAAARLCLRSHDSDLRLWDTSAERELLVQPLPGLSQVAAVSSGCAVIARDEARLVSSTGASLLLASGATAVAADKGEILVAAGDRVLAFDAAGKQLSTWQTGRDVSAMARFQHTLVVGRRNGELLVIPLAPGSAPRATSFESPIASRVLRIMEGPRGTIIAGFRDGSVAVWDPLSGRRLYNWSLHGPAVHLLLRGTTVYAVSELADTLREDLSILERDYCDLLREIWKMVPVVWESGKPVKRPPPEGHLCRR